MFLIQLLLTLVIYAVILYVLWWGLEKVGLPEPFHKVATVILVVITVIVLVGILMGSIPIFPILNLR